MPYDPALQPFIDTISEVMPASPHNLSLLDFRAAADRFVADPPPRPSGITVSDQIAERGQERVPVRIYRPDVAGKQPCLIYFHGGGWMSGSIASHDQLCQRFASEVPCTVVNVGYRLIPEHPFPAAVNDTTAAIEWVTMQAAGLGVDSARIVAGGDSAGANLVAGASIVLRDGGGPPLKGQLLLYPATTTDFDFPSCIENADAPFLSMPYLRWLWEHYLDGDLATTDPRAVPMLADSHANLPSALVMTAQYDPLRDDGETYAAKLKAAGVKVAVRRAPRLIHGFIRATAISQDAEIEFGAACDWLRQRFCIS